MNEKMEKEILEQPQVFDGIFKSYVKDGKIDLDLPTGFSEVKFIASGSSYNCGLLGKKFLENIAGMDASFEYSSEFNANENRTIRKDVLYFFISQSGETSDTKRALGTIKQKGGTTFALINNSNSTLYNECDYKMDIKAGIEESIAATKSFLGAILCLWLVALYVAQNKGIDIKTHLDSMQTIGSKIKKVIEGTKGLDDAADILSKLKSFPVIGYNYNYVCAIEGSLKIKETSYIDVNAYPTGEFLHGHTAILNENSIIVEIALAGMSEFESKTLNKIDSDYNPKTIIITDDKDRKGTLLTIKFDSFEDEITRILSVVTLMQILALKIALKLGRNVDAPNGLSKVVQG